MASPVLSTSLNGSNQPVLNWTASSLSGLLGYKIFKNTVQIALVANDVLTYTDTNVDPSVCYDYQIKAYNLVQLYRLSTGDTEGLHWQKNGDDGIVDLPDATNPITLTVDDGITLFDSMGPKTFGSVVSVGVAKTGGTVIDGEDGNPMGIIPNGTIFNTGSQISMGYASGSDVSITDISITETQLDSSDVENQCTNGEDGGGGDGPITNVPDIMLNLKIIQGEITTDCKTLTATNNTGNYNVDTNPGGFGTPNPDRSSLGIILFILLHKSTGYELQPIASYSYVTATSWAATIGEDGYYEILAIAAPIYAAGTYELNNIVLFNGAFYKANKETDNDPSNTDDWDVITDNEDFQNGTNVSISSNDYLVTCLSQKCRANALINLTKKGCCDNAEERKLNKIDTQLEGAIANADFGNWEAAQINIETLQQICSDLKCLDC